MRRTTTLVTVLLLALLSLTACSDDSGTGNTGSSTGSSGKGTTIDITIKDGKVTPHGDRVKAKVGQPVTLTARVNPGTGPVTFLDGEQVIGQANPDSASLARFTTDRLAAGAHWLQAKQGTAISARFSQAVSNGDTSVWFRSANGDYIGQGATASYVPPSATITTSN